MKTAIQTIAIFAIISLQSLSLSAKSNGSFKSYTQVTDKEILIESTKGVKVLFTAYDNNNINIQYFSNDENVSLTSPSMILSNIELSGSMYMEELNEMIQITTTTEDGLEIRIDRNNFEFSFVDKATGTEVFEVTDVLASLTITSKAPKTLLAMN